MCSVIHYTRVRHYSQCLEAVFFFNLNTPVQVKLRVLANASSSVDIIVSLASLSCFLFHIQQLMDMTGKSEEDVIIALHDAENDANRAVIMLLEGGSEQVGMRKLDFAYCLNVFRNIRLMKCCATWRSARFLHHLKKQ